MSSKINLQTCEYACKSSIFQDNQLISHKKYTNYKRLDTGISKWGIKALCSVTANHSYSSEFKIEMVRKYINGEGSVTDLCARYGIPTHTKQLCQFFHRFLGVMQQGVTHFWRTAGIKHFHLIDTLILQGNIWIYKRI